MAPQSVSEDGVFAAMPQPAVPSIPTYPQRRKYPMAKSLPLLVATLLACCVAFADGYRLTTVVQGLEYP